MLHAGGGLATTRLKAGGSPCAGTPELHLPGRPVQVCGLQAEETSVLCRSLGCGEVLRAPRPDDIWEPGDRSPKTVTCQGNESSIFSCKFDMNVWNHCSLLSEAQVVCSGREASLGPLRGAPFHSGGGGGAGLTGGPLPGREPDECVHPHCPSTPSAGIPAWGRRATWSIPRTPPRTRTLSSVM